MAVRSLLAAALAALLLAGCAAPPAPAPSTAATTAPLAAGLAPGANLTLAPPPLPPPQLEYLGCRQLHTFFPFPEAALQQLGFAVPPGFSYATVDPAGGVANVFVAWWLCGDGRLNHTLRPAFGPTGSMLVAVMVQPPAALANASVDLDLYTIVWAVGSDAAAAHLGAIPDIGDRVEQATVAPGASATVGPLVEDTATATFPFGAFTVDTAVQAAPDANPASVYRVWQVSNGTASGYLEVRNSPGATVGMGAADLRYTGDPSAGAPPLTPGQAHVVDGIGVQLVPRALPAGA